MIFKKIITINTSKHFEIVDITSKINELIDISDGLVNIFTKHSTSAIIVNENEKGLINDFEAMLDEIIPNISWKHDMIDNNAISHLKSFILSSSETIPIKNQKLDLGTWQSVFFVGLDGPRKNRKIDLTIIG